MPRPHPHTGSEDALYSPPPSVWLETKGRSVTYCLPHVKAWQTEDKKFDLGGWGGSGSGDPGSFSFPQIECEED